MPGEAPSGDGPGLRFAWPPQLVWRDLTWSPGGGQRLRAERLAVSVSPAALLRGRIGVRSIEIDQGVLHHALPASRLERLHRLASLSEREETGGTVAPGRTEGRPGEVRVEVRSFTTDPPGLRFDRIEGWGATPRRGAWSLRLAASRNDSLRIPLRIEGSGGAGRTQVALSSALSPHRAIHLRRDGGPEARWVLTGTDDGALLLAVLGVPEAPGRPWIRGTVAFSLEGTSLNDLPGLVGEISVERLGPPGGSWSIDGWLCLDEGTVSLEEVALFRGSERIAIAGRFAVPSLRSIDGWRAEGTVRGAPLRIAGSADRVEERLLLRVREASWGNAVAGPGSLQVGPWGSGETGLQLAGGIGLGAGVIRGKGTLPGTGEGIRLVASGVPLEELLPWLPIHLPGRWRGGIDGAGTFVRSGSGWTGKGTIRAPALRIDRLPLLDEIETLAGGSGRLVIDSLRADWELRETGWRVDGIEGSASGMRLFGTVTGSESDSLLGLLTLHPEADPVASRILRLLGGDPSGLVLGVAVRGDAVTLQPLGAAEQEDWSARIRRRGDAPRGSLNEGNVPRRESGSFP
ncbi:MAG: hypothetical protein GF346_09575 [Candidatus Eisenbacteria bacterium]|nr:hypothetical protein [Candidatus Latescibacterota bacterium]MBD3302682.1 hypothetical protein [Candidatus Eisenbacteria bacterium]